MFGINNYLWLGLLSTTLFLMKAIMAIGAEDSLELEMGGDIDPPDPHQAVFLLSLQSLLIFGMSLGWIGYWNDLYNILSPWGANILGGVVGICMIFLFAYIMTRIRKLNTSPATIYKPKIGDMVETYTTIPVRHTGHGKIKMTTRERVDYHNACADEKEPIASFTRAVIVGLEPSGVLIIKRKN